jgi:hypothetical protein
MEDDGLIMTGDLPDGKNVECGLIVMGDLPKWKMWCDKCEKWDLPGEVLKGWQEKGRKTWCFLIIPDRSVWKLNASWLQGWPDNSSS